jgi:hypothetical protein
MAVVALTGAGSGRKTRSKIKDQRKSAVRKNMVGYFITIGIFFITFSIAKYTNNVSKQNSHGRTVK